jgi:hypothetical protein
VVQRYIPPFLIHDYKFDFRFYILISSLAPYTIYIYKEGLARFCTQPYHPPTYANLDRKFMHLTNTSINKENSEATGQQFTKLASETLKEISEIDPHKGPTLWNRICDVSLLSMLAIWSSIVNGINTFNSERRVFGVKAADKGLPALDSFSRYFHILGIDILVAENLQPIVLELNDRPSMVVTYECEAELKKNLILDAFSHISVDGTPLDGEGTSPNWVKLLPIDPQAPLAPTVTEIIGRTAAVFRMCAANRERPHYEESKPVKGKSQSLQTFSDFSDCQ